MRPVCKMTQRWFGLPNYNLKPMAKASQPEPLFYIRTDDGITEMAVLERWKAAGRVLVLHEGDEGEYAVSDYLTGRRCTSNKRKVTAKRQAEEMMAKVAGKIASGEFDWAVYPEINSPDFIAGWNAAQDLFRSTGNYLAGVLLAFHHRPTDPSEPRSNGSAGESQFG